VFLLRRRGLTGPFKTPGYPVTPLVFIGIMIWTAVSLVMQRPLSVVLGLATVFAGLVVWRVVSGRGATVVPAAEGASTGH